MQASQGWRRIVARSDERDARPLDEVEAEVLMCSAVTSPMKGASRDRRDADSTRRPTGKPDVTGQFRVGHALGHPLGYASIARRDRPNRLRISGSA